MLSISPLPVTASGAFVDEASAAIAAWLGLRFAVSRVTLARSAGAGDAANGGMRNDGSAGMGMAVWVIGSTNVPVVLTGASASCAKCSDLRLAEGPSPIVNAGCGTPTRLCGPQNAVLTRNVTGST